MELTLENVMSLLEGERFTVLEEERGIRIIDDIYEWDDGFDRRGHVPKIMLAALALGLHPNQFEDDSEYETGTYWSSWTGKDSDILHINVLFIFPDKV